MAGLFRLLASILAHVFWNRAGRRGPLPPVRLPGRRTTHLPVPSPWQIMAATWAAERVWTAYGPTVKQKLKQHPAPMAHKISDLLPGPEQVAPAPPNAQKPVQATTPVHTIKASKPSGAATQRLPQNDTDDATLPSGSVLRSIRPSN